MCDPASIYNFYYDKRTAVRNGNKVASWGKTISTSPTVPASTQYAHEFGDCDSQRSATDSLSIDGLGVFSVRVQWQTLLPNTPAMRTLLAVCSSLGGPPCRVTTVACGSTSARRGPINGRPPARANTALNPREVRTDFLDSSRQSASVERRERH